MSDFMMFSYTCDTIEYKIYIAGDYQDAIRVCRNFCRDGFCVSVQKADYVYTGGMESGVCITIINYPRFPCYRTELLTRAEDLAMELQYELCQKSYTIVGPDISIFKSTEK